MKKNHLLDKAFFFKRKENNTGTVHLLTTACQKLLRAGSALTRQRSKEKSCHLITTFRHPRSSQYPLSQVQVNIELRKVGI